MNPIGNGKTAQGVGAVIAGAIVAWAKASGFEIEPDVALYVVGGIQAGIGILAKFIRWKRGA